MHPLLFYRSHRRAEYECSKLRILFARAIERNWNCGVVNEWNHRRWTGEGGLGQRRLTGVCTLTPDIGQCSMCYCICAKKIPPFQLTDKIFTWHRCSVLNKYLNMQFMFHHLFLKLGFRGSKTKYYCLCLLYYLFYETRPLKNC